MSSQAMRTQFVFAAAVLLLLLSMATFAIAAVHNINTDQNSLLVLKDQIKSHPNNIPSTNWSSSCPVCHWIGITCDPFHHRVIGLNLFDMGLVGTIPPHLGNLSFLSELYLSNNSFHGSLPNELARLHRLKRIVLDFNNFNGEIPSWFVKLPKLETLSVSYNSFSGTIPISLFNITSLKKLDLSGNKLGGVLPLNVFNSSSLQSLSAEDNMLSGSIPSFVSKNLPLQTISLSSNNLSGELPEPVFYNLPDLKWLYLSKNQFSGKLPLSLFSCKQLQVLQLSHNRLEPYIPREISNLTMLKEIQLSHNNFHQGKNTIPNEIGYLPNLEVMGFCSANLCGNIPLSIFNTSTITKIALCDNQLSGNLPSNLGTMLPNLEALLLWQNHLSGKISSSLANATKLRLLELDTNSFSSYIPNIFKNLKDLEYLSLGDNNLIVEPSIPELNIINSLTNCRHLRSIFLSNTPFNSTLPISFGNLSTSLEFLDFSNCKLKGSIPANIGNLSGLLFISLLKNQLTGNIPIEIGKLQNLQGLYLGLNNLEGFLPQELCQLKYLDALYLSHNRFSGPIPTWLGNMTTLTELWLRENNFNLMIPSTLWDLSNLLSLDLSSNELSGYLAPKMSNLKVIIEVYLSKNKLLGSIPSSIGDLQNLKNLSLDQNRLGGLIPESFGNLVSLEFLDLSKNNLCGVVPKSLEGLVYLKLFNVSFNKLEGPIPMGEPFTNFSAQLFIGNKGLCGGAPCLHLPKCNGPVLSQSPKTIAIVLKFVLIAVVFIMLLLTFMYVLLKCQRHKKQSVRKVDAIVAKWRRISYYELQQATNGFIDTNLLGIGSFGKVYKGILSDGLSVAIKVFNLDQERAFRSFEAECEVLCNIRHRNLTKVISSCSNTDFKALVLSYMSNGNLEKWLHSHNLYLNIIQRLNIMIDVATALDYLHNGCSAPIIHCDMKPNNVLLDEEMVAHVTDFGISKLLSEGDSITQTMTLATMGYMAPEYGLEGIVSKQGDVYSYGILLMETFTRKKPIHQMFEGEVNIKQWVKESYPDVIMDVIDPTLMIEEQQHFDTKKDCFVSIMKLALDCSAESPSERKSIEDALITLENIKMKFLNETRYIRLSA